MGSCRWGAGANFSFELQIGDAFGLGKNGVALLVKLMAEFIGPLGKLGNGELEVGIGLGGLLLVLCTFQDSDGSTDIGLDRVDRAGKLMTFAGRSRYCRRCRI